MFDFVKGHWVGVRLLPPKIFVHWEIKLSVTKIFYRHYEIVLAWWGLAPPNPQQIKHCYIDIFTMERLTEWMSRYVQTEMTIENSRTWGFKDLHIIFIIFIFKTMVLSLNWLCWYGYYVILIWYHSSDAILSISERWHLSCLPIKSWSRTVWNSTLNSLFISTLSVCISFHCISSAFLNV